jgi:hypothetical protein
MPRERERKAGERESFLPNKIINSQHIQMLKSAAQMCCSSSSLSLQNALSCSSLFLQKLFTLESRSKQRKAEY